jgi:hypothetical protein
MQNNADATGGFDDCHVSHFEKIMVVVAVAKLVLALAISMVHINKAAVACACIAFSSGVHGLSGKPDHNGVYKSAACFCCDKLLRWCDNEAVSLKLLRGCRKSYEASEFVHPDLKEYYTYKGQGSELWMSSMMLSPRSVWVRDTGEAPNKAGSAWAPLLRRLLHESQRSSRGREVFCVATEGNCANISKFRKVIAKVSKRERFHCSATSTCKAAYGTNFYMRRFSVQNVPGKRAFSNTKTFNGIQI